jgi:pimeloyl-ACP methyl ester carboxylesterase
MRRLPGLALALLLAASVALVWGQTPAPPEEKTIPVFGQTIHYWDAGSGPIVVLVHGLGSSKNGDWRLAFGPLTKKYRVVAPDQIGFGHSDKPLMDYSIQTYVDFLNEFLHQVKIQKASLMGESLGGWISAMYTLEASNDAHMVPVEKLVLVDAAGLQQSKPIPDLNPSTLEGERKLMQVVFYDSSWVTDDVVKKALEERIHANISYTVRSILSNPVLPSERLDGKSHCLLSLRQAGRAVRVREVLHDLQRAAQSPPVRGRPLLLSGLPRSVRRGARQQPWELKPKSACRSTPTLGLRPRPAGWRATSATARAWKTTRMHSCKKPW